MSGSLGLSPVQAFVTYSANEAKYANANAASSAQATSLISYFTKAASGLTSPATLLKDYKALSVVLGAFGIGDQIQYPALVNALLTQNPASTSSVAYRSGNAKFLSFAKALHNWSPPPFGTAAGVNAIISAYQTNIFEAAAGAQTPGLQQALYFRRQAGSVQSLTQLQSDATLLQVAVTGIGLPLPAFDNLDFNQQTALLKSKLNIADLQKPSYVNHLSELYLVQQQLSSGGVTPAPLPGSVVSLFAPNGSSNAGNNLLTILQTQEQSSSGLTSTLLGTQTTSASGLLSLFA